MSLPLTEKMKSIFGLHNGGVVEQYKTEANVNKPKFIKKTKEYNYKGFKIETICCFTWSYKIYSKNGNELHKQSIGGFVEEENALKEAENYIDKLKKKNNTNDYMNYKYKPDIAYLIKNIQEGAIDGISLEPDKLIKNIAELLLEIAKQYNQKPNNDSSEIKINTNDIAKVQLTDYGKEDVLKEIADTYNYTFPDLKKRQYLALQLHELMFLFGRYLYNGNKQIFQNNEIIIEQN